MKVPELLSPVGDMECLKSAVQNGADCVYLGGAQFNARARATNFDDEGLKQAIEYAHLRNTRVNLTLNILLKNNELQDAIKLAVYAYNIGVDAIIIQDLGLASILHNLYPQIKLHASTQMTVHNLEGVKQLEKLGYTRVVLARELSIDEIKYIRENTSIELEVFIHGALCISYSGECLFSSMVGGRSGNRGECAGPCRMKYDLLEDDNGNINKIDSGYLLSPHDQTAKDYIKELIDIGIDCFKIEGRLKTPEYVGTVTRFYRNLIDEYINKSNEISKIENTNNYNKFNVSEKDLVQVFNRGGLEQGHFNNSENRNLIYSKTPGNTGLYLGSIIAYNSNKSYIKLKLENEVSIGDRISINDDSYNVSELLADGQNIKQTNKGLIVEIGRVKGNIKQGLDVYKIESKELNEKIDSTFINDKQTKKIKLQADLKIKVGKNLELKVLSIDDSLFDYYKTISVKSISEVKAVIAQNRPLEKSTIIEQLSKTGNTQFEFAKINIDLDDNAFVPMGAIKELRRIALDNLQEEVIKHTTHSIEIKPDNLLEQIINNDLENSLSNKPKISILLNELNNNYDYSCLKNIDRVYIPFKYFANNNYNDLIEKIINNFDVFLYMPLVLRDRDIEKLHCDLIFDKAKERGIKGFVASHISQIESLRKYGMPIIANYSLNIFNNISVSKLSKIGFSEFTPSVELSKIELQNLLDVNTDLVHNSFNDSLKSEIIVYGKTPLMTNAYCFLGKTNKCYNECKKYCMNGKKYYLQDRLNFKFRIIPDNLTTTTTIYNSKITSYDYSDFKVDSIRLDFIDETIEQMQNVVDMTANNKRMEGAEFTNGRVK